MLQHWKCHSGQQYACGVCPFRSYLSEVVRMHRCPGLTGAAGVARKPSAPHAARQKKEQQTRKHARRRHKPERGPIGSPAAATRINPLHLHLKRQLAATPQVPLQAGPPVETILVLQQAVTAPPTSHRWPLTAVPQALHPARPTLAPALSLQLAPFPARSPASPLLMAPRPPHCNLLATTQVHQQAQAAKTGPRLRKQKTPTPTLTPLPCTKTQT